MPLSLTLPEGTRAASPLRLSPNKKRVPSEQHLMNTWAGELSNQIKKPKTPPPPASYTNSPPRSEFLAAMQPVMLAPPNKPTKIPSPRKHKTSERAQPATLDAWPGGRTTTKPALLKTLEAFIHKELNTLNQLNAPPNASRIQVFRQAFSLFASSFKTYEPLLHQILNEYDTLLANYSTELHTVPQVKAEIASLRKGATQQMEDLKREFEKEKGELHEKLRVQYKLHKILETENSELRNKLDDHIMKAAQSAERHEELKNSTVTLTQALVRLEDDNTARALVENTQQSEVLRLKNGLEKANAEVDRLKNATVELEDQVHGLVSADVLYEKDNQIDLLRKEMASMRNNNRDLTARFNTLKSSMNKMIERDSDGSESESRARERGFGGPVSNAVVDDLVEQIEQLKAQMNESEAKKGGRNEDENIESESFRPEGNYFNGRGMGEDVPEYLRYEGPLRNWRLSKRECERAVNDVWIAKEEWLEYNDDGVDDIHLSDYIYLYLVEKYEGNQALIAEFGYNLIDALERYIADSDCNIFLRVLQGELAEEVRDDELQLLVSIPQVMEEEDLAIHNGHASGLLPIPIYMRRLRRLLTTKPETSFAKLQKALQFEAKKGRNVAYNELFEEDEDGNQGDFCELLRAQHLEEIILYDRQLVDAIQAASEKEGRTGKLTIAALRNVIQQNDPEKNRTEINVYLARGANCNVAEVSEKESAEELIDVAKFILRLRDGLLKKSEKN
jgi:hypothetical protein